MFDACLVLGKHLRVGFGTTWGDGRLDYRESRRMTLPIAMTPESRASEEIGHGDMEWVSEG